MGILARKIIAWYHKNHRPLPWREGRDCYSIWISEIMLQQTRVDQMLPYYHRFMARFPTVHKLAAAEEQEVLLAWAGLGYYSRARYLHKTARLLAAREDLSFPKTFKEWRALPGIGDYTAAAIVSQCFNDPIPVVDGNVLRVVSRLWALEQDVKKTAVKKQIFQWLQEEISHQEAGNFNQAMMELGALVCKPHNARCTQCPINSLCAAFARGTVERYPIKSPSPKRKLIEQRVLVIRYQNLFLLIQRKGRGMLTNMWEFPVIEAEFQQNDEWGRELLNDYITAIGPWMKHEYTHRLLHYQPLLLKSPRKIVPLKRHRWLTIDEFNQVAIHKAHQKIIEHPRCREWFTQ